MVQLVQPFMTLASTEFIQPAWRDTIGESINLALGLQKGDPTYDSTAIAHHLGES